MKPYTQMSAAELAQATKQYQQKVIDKTVPLNAKELELWEQAQRNIAASFTEKSVISSGNNYVRANQLSHFPAMGTLYLSRRDRC